MDTKPQGIQVDPGKPLVSGLGGWLILVQIGLYAGIIAAVMLFFTSIATILATDTWTMLTSRDSELYHVLWGPLIVFETVTSVALFAFIIYILINFYGRKRILPSLMIIYYAGGLLLGVLNFALLLMIPMAREMMDFSDYRDLIRSALSCLIWIPYFRRSVRVRNTFVH